MIQNLIKHWIERERIDYKVVLILLMLKKVSDNWKVEFEEAYKEILRYGLSEEEAREEAKKPEWHSGIDFPEEFLWENIRKDVERLPEKLHMALKSIVERNSQFLGVENLLNFMTLSENIEKIRKLFEEISGFDTAKIDFSEIFDYIIIEHSLKEAKKGGIYTPKEIIFLILHLLEPKSSESIYDPSSSYGEFLLMAHKFAKERNIEISLYGEEEKEEQYLISKINLTLNGVIDFNVVHTNSLLNPGFKENGTFKKFDIVVSNPEWNQKNYHEEKLKTGEFWRERFKYGFPSKQSADWVWIQHMIASANDNRGRIGIVMDGGCLFRGGKEKAIRAKILEDDLIECVILLPEKLFYSNKGASGVILILNKNKPENRKKKVLIIDASKEYGKHPSFRRLNILQKENIDKIVQAYKEFKEIKGFSRILDINEIKENDYNLNVGRYIFQEEVEEEVDILKEFSELDELGRNVVEIWKKIEEYKNELSKVLK